MYDPNSAIFIAARALVGFYLAQIGVFSLGGCCVALSRGNHWGLLLLPVGIAALVFAMRTLRHVAADLQHNR